jgi:gp16 family phage-associated protein
MITDEDMQLKLEAACGKSQKEWAEAHGFSQSYVNQVVNGKKKFPERIAKILGYKKVKSWVKLR